MPAPRDERLLSERFGALLFTLREQEKLSQRAAAKLIGISQTRLVSLEQGLDHNTGKPTLPSPEQVTRMAAAYKYPRRVLLMLAGYVPWLLTEAEARELDTFAALAPEVRGRLLAAATP